MIIDRKIVRNSGATLEPCVYKHGHGVREQGLKMGYYPKIFAPILQLTDDGYVMPQLYPPSEVCLSEALRRLAMLWTTPEPDVTATDTTDRARHHAIQVSPLACTDTIAEILERWRVRTANTVGTRVTVVHGDPTLENYMLNGVWLDPSIRPLPLEAELDGGKLLQSYFGYATSLGLIGWSEQRRIRNFIHDQKLNLDLCAYYLVTHIVRLYRVQPHARGWALDVLTTLEARMEELPCK